MHLNKKQKERLRKIFGGMATPDEIVSLERLDAKKVHEIVDFIAEIQDGAEKDFEAKYAKLEESFGYILNSFNNYRKVSVDQTSTVIKSLETFTKELSTRMEGLKPTEDAGWNKNAAPLFRQMIEALSGVKDKVAEGVEVQTRWKFPQYSSVSLRNKDFANINPAVQPFGIPDFDQIFLTYSGSNVTVVEYYANGVKVAQLNLTYSGSNLIEVTRTQ